MKNYIKLLFVTACILSCNVKCNPATVAELIRMGTDIVELIQLVSQLSNALDGQVEEATTQTKQYVGENANVNDIAIYWEKEWNAIKKKYADIKSNLKTLKNKSEDYFDELKSNNEQFRFGEPKTRDSLSNVVLKAQWDKEYEKVLQSVEKAKQMMLEGDDIYHELKGLAGRQQLKIEMNSLKSISIEAANLCRDIREFENNVRGVFKTQEQSVSESEVEVEKNIDKNEDIVIQDQPSDKDQNSLNLVDSASSDDIRENTNTSEPKTNEADTIPRVTITEFFEHQSQNNKSEGITFKVKFKTQNITRDMLCCIFIYDEKGIPIKTTQSDYANSNGYLCYSKNVSPTEGGENLEAYLFPYHLINSGGISLEKYKAQAYVYIKDGKGEWASLTKSPDLYFSIP